MCLYHTIDTMNIVWIYRRYLGFGIYFECIAKPKIDTWWPYSIEYIKIVFGGYNDIALYDAFFDLWIW